jgi:hypothetical protein
MATHQNDHSNYDMRPHEETWANFGRLAKWILIGSLILVAGMGLFLTGNHNHPTF